LLSSGGKICKKCGTENRAGARYCRVCRASLLEEEQKPYKQTALQLLKGSMNSLHKAYFELFGPNPALTGVVTKVEDGGMTEIKFEPLWIFAIISWLVGLILASAPRGFIGFLLLVAVSIALLFLSQRYYQKPYVTLLSFLAFSKESSFRTLKIGVRRDDGQNVEVKMIGDPEGIAPSVGERVHVWGVYEDESKTTMRAWKVQTVDSSLKPRGEPLRTHRLLPLIPMLLFPYLVFSLLALLRLILGG